MCLVVYEDWLVVVFIVVFENLFFSLIIDLLKFDGGSYGKFYSFVKLNDLRVGKLWD